MTPLPPVRKRTDYNSIKPDDLTFALFYDRVLNTSAMRESREFDIVPEEPKTTKKTRKGRKWGKRK
jgi:hypothetical protein